MKAPILERLDKILPAGLALAWLLNAALYAAAEVSQLYPGKGNEHSAAAGRVPDFSRAGYRAGEATIPELPVKTNVKDFGAAGDGLVDDTEAFLKAIRATVDGAVWIPAGRYKITRMLVIAEREIVLRGEDWEKTVLYFPDSLTRALGDGKRHAPGKSWSWSGGFVTFAGRDRGSVLTAITAAASRGDRKLQVASAAGIRPGQWVRVVLRDLDGSLARHLHAGYLEGSEHYRGKKLVDFSSRVESVAGRTVVLQRPLRTDVRLQWRPVIYASDPSMEDSGIERLTLEFPAEQYAGHHREPGFNAVSFEGAHNCWARRLRIVNADGGVFFRNNAKFCTAESIRFTADRDRLRSGYGEDPGEPRTLQVGGHHGVLIMGYAQDNRVADVDFHFRFVHDLCVSAWAAGNVFAGITAIDLAIDHHRRAPYENLFTEINAGTGARLWQRGGDPGDGPPSGAGETFWNIRADTPQNVPGFAVKWNVVGITTGLPTGMKVNETWWEAIAPDRLTPSDLYFAQKYGR